MHGSLDACLQRPAMTIREAQKAGLGQSYKMTVEELDATLRALDA